MTTADLTSFQRTLREMLPDGNITGILAALKKALPEGTDKYNTVFQLETRLNSTNRDRLRGILSQDQLEVAYNRIASDLLDLIDALEPADFDAATADGPGHVSKTGSILYRIPHTMEVEEEYRCVVRLAFEDEVIIRNIEITRDTVLKEVRVAEVMEVELLDPNEQPAFTIRRLNSAEQFLEKNDYTEWIFFVKPLRTGELPLVLRVAVLEIIDEHERKKEIVLEELIRVVADAPEEGEAVTGFQNAGYSISTGGVSEGPARIVPPAQPGAGVAPQPAPTQAPPMPQGASKGGGRNRYTLAMVALLMALAGIWATGSQLGWWGGEAVLSDTQTDRRDWGEALHSGTKEAFMGYLQEHPGGLFKSVAQYKLDSIQQAETLPKGTTPVLQMSEEDTSSMEQPDEAPLTGLPQKKTKPSQSRQPKTNLPKPPSAPKPTPELQPNTPQVSPSLPTPPPPTNKRRTGFEMVAVQGGSMTIGCDGSKDECPHPVTLKNFKIGKYEVTQGDWKEIMGRNPSHFNYSGCDECPVELVSWTEVQEFIKKANEKYHAKFRLPFEAEWEYAARGGQLSKGFKYAGSNTFGAVGWNHGNSEETHRVGQKRPNELGLYDMSGNVWEWCLDTYKPYPGCSSRTTDDRIIRGGSFRNYDKQCRSCNRNYNWPDKKDYTIGFRLLRED